MHNIVWHIKRIRTDGNFSDSFPQMLYSITIYIVQHLSIEVKKKGKSTYIAIQIKRMISA